MADNSLVGPLTLAELLALWEGAVDSTYAQPFVQAGDGGGLEVYSQGFAQHVRVSQAVDASTQAMYILPFSGQTAPPASGAQLATVTLTFTRGGYLDRPLVLGAGMVWVDEVAIDSSNLGPVGVDTGRRYLLTQTVVFMPGEQGPLTAQAVAEKPGAGYNNPAPGTISLVEQPGADFANVQATVSLRATAPLAGPPTPASRTQLVALNQADMPVPEQLGQYVTFSAGANQTKNGRITAFAPPDPAHNIGSVVDLEQFAVTTAFTVFAGTFLPGEVVDVKSGINLVGRGTVLAARVDAATGRLRVAFVVIQGAVAAGNTLKGELSTATANVDLVYLDGTFNAEVGTATWRVLDWVLDWKLTTTNALSPSGGAVAMLDALGEERGLPRHPGEIDDDYRRRVSQVADVVSPNAIRRALNRALGGYPWCFREVGGALLPGFYFDRVLPSGAGDPMGDFFDMDVGLFSGVYTSGTFLFEEPVQYRNAAGWVLQSGFWGSYLDGVGAAHASAGAGFTLGHPKGTVTAITAGDKIVGLRSGAVFTPAAVVANPNAQATAWHVLLDYVDFRAFFAVGIPDVDFGEFGFAYDQGAHDAYDASPFDAFYDGFAAGSAAFNLRVYNAVEKVRAGGVSWLLYRTRGEPCV
jgi:hypothetical protein